MYITSAGLFQLPVAIVKVTLTLSLILSSNEKDNYIFF